MKQIYAAPLLILIGLAGCTSAAPPPPLAGTASGQCPLDGEVGSDAMDATIHGYLTRHPEELMEMSDALRRKQQAAQQVQAKQALAQHHDAIFVDPTDPVAGNPAAMVTVVEFFDSECPFCKKEAADLSRLITENKDVRIVYKEYPILGLGSQVAARAALASLKQGKYEAFHAALMADTTPEHQLSEPRLLEIAKGVGLDVDRLKADMTAPQIAAKIAGNVALARQVGITGTPGLVIGAKVMFGAVPYPVLLQAVAEARGQKQ